jgi:hypothetical protein
VRNQSSNLLITEALIKTGYDVGKEIVERVEIPDDITSIELISFFTTIVNTQAWTWIGVLLIDSDEKEI